MWKPSIYQGTELHQNVSSGVILTEQSLVLQSVTRASAGDYTCLAANTEGRGTSNPVTLRVRCKYYCFFFFFLCSKTTSNEPNRLHLDPYSVLDFAFDIQNVCSYGKHW